MSFSRPIPTAHPDWLAQFTIWSSRFACSLSCLPLVAIVSAVRWYLVRTQSHSGLAFCTRSLPGKIRLHPDLCTDGKLSGTVQCGATTENRWISSISLSPDAHCNIISYQCAHAYFVSPNANFYTARSHNWHCQCKLVIWILQKANKLCT